ncbi:MAG: hypothetical protein H6733_13820 [Alphaproteobacteria bacterium]|nr:hypothetical protein [Alphaproteobacteria bacterium]
MNATELPQSDDVRTRQLVERARRTLADAADPAEGWRALARALGGHLHDDGAERWAAFGFFAPDLVHHGVSPGDVYVELLTPSRPVRLDRAVQDVHVVRTLVPARREGDTWWAAATGIAPGHRARLGTLYRLRYLDPREGWKAMVDPLAVSLPFGPFGPAELYDVDRLHADRADADWFAARAAAGTPADDGIPRMADPGNLLEVHLGTATAAGTVAGLTRRLRVLADKVARDLPLDAGDHCLLGYDALQLMPIHCTVAAEGGPPCWDEPDDAEQLSTSFDVVARRPATTNWGYDVVIGGCAAPNPALLETRRPDEMVDLAVAMHTFPGRPMALVLDVVFGHADNQAVDLLPRQFFLGPNMYGQDLNYRHPAVRGILLELQRRLVDLGADGVRVDGAQDFRVWDPVTRTLLHDDAYLDAMSAEVAHVAGTAYRPWMVFEDGRPWPREDWELASSYRAVTEQQPHAWQWGPLTFAHNTPFLYTFWVAKWWRITEIARHGSQWISGCANHDTVRRGTQVSPRVNINRRLGTTLLDILDHAYDNAAANLLTYAAFPGTPMDFLNASMRASWGFMRNTDARYAVKVVAEETSFLDWQVDAVSYDKVGRFRRLKGLGFQRLDDLRAFTRVLAAAIDATDGDEDATADILRTAAARMPGVPDTVDVAGLRAFAAAYMDDVHDYCNVSHYESELDPVRTAFNLALRRFRLDRPWLRGDLGPDDVLGRREPTDGAVLVHALRHAPDGSEQVLMIANMQGDTVTVTPTALPIPGLAAEGWEPVLASPHRPLEAADAPHALADSEGVVFRRACG